KEKEAAVDSQEFEKAARLRDEERLLAEKLEEMRKDWHSSRDIKEPVVSAREIASIISEWTGIPVVHLTEEESKRLLRMESEIHQRLISQEEAVTSVARAIRRTRSGLKDPNRPIGSFLFLGPTGVGKTELARRLSEFLFGSQDAIVRMDMSEYMERHEVSKLIGAPPGYVGYEEGGKLTEAIRRRPYSVVLFDEIEKAHPDIFNILLQIMEDGRLTDGQGHIVDFRNAVIIMTSNVGAKDIFKSRSLGFSDSTGETLNWNKMHTSIMEAVRKTFRPEFINRVDELVVFRSLTRENMIAILDLMMSEVTERLKDQHIQLVVSQQAKELILEKGYDPKFGARPLRRTIQQMVEDKLADLILEGALSEGTRISVNTSGAELTFSDLGKLDNNENTDSDQ
nr:AAA family ATPase [Synergistales bacterium]